MKAAFLTGICKIELGDVPSPTIQNETDVLLDVEVVGLCGSDMHYYRTGRIGEMVVEYPFITGHEFAGRVLEVGPAVTNVKVGQRVAVDPLMWCGRCDQCLSGREHTCRNQKFLGCPGQSPGCLCERIVMPAQSCFPRAGKRLCRPGGADRAVFDRPVHATMGRRPGWEVRCDSRLGANRTLHIGLLQSSCRRAESLHDRYSSRAR